MEQTLGQDTTPNGWISRTPEPEELPTAGLNGLHIDALRKLLNKLDKCAEEWGTHIVDEARFGLYDGNGDMVAVLIGFDVNLNMHYLVGVD